MPELWGRQTSPNVQCGSWALLEPGVPFIRHDVGGYFGGLDSAAFRALTPGDLHPGHVLYRCYDIDIARRGFPAVRACYDRLCQRPAYSEAVMISCESLRDTA